MANKLAAEFIVEALEELGVKRVYGIAGDSLNGITSAIYKSKKIKWVHVRHEEAAAFAASAEAQLTGELAVCAGSCGPGNMHLINGLYDANRSGARVLAIAAQIPSMEVGSNYFQETNPEALFKDCSQFCATVNQVEQLPILFNAAIQSTYTKNGVAVLTISGDTALKPLTNYIPRSTPIPATPIVTPNITELQKAAEILNGAKKITLLCGYGVKDAHSSVINLAKCLQSPIVHALRGKEFIEYDNPFDVGMTGLIGVSSGYFAMEDCEVLVLLGTSFPYRSFYSKKARIIQVDINGANLGLRTPIELGLIGDVKSTIESLLPLLTENQNSTFLNLARTHYVNTRKELDALAIPGKKPIHPQYLAKLISDLARDDAIFSCDVGTPTAWAARYLHMNGKRRLLGSFNHGSMANALSQAIGAQAAFADKQVVAMCGDGGFAMLMGEILTLVQEQLPIKIVIFNNSALGFVQLEMIATGIMNNGVELKNPNFAKLAEAIGIKGIRIESPEDLEAGLKDAFTHTGPVIVDVVTHTYELIMPPKITMEHAKGFSLFALKAIINGKGDVLVDLAKTNLWN